MVGWTTYIYSGSETTYLWANSENLRSIDLMDTYEWDYDDFKSKVDSKF